MSRPTVPVAGTFVTLRFQLVFVIGRVAPASVSGSTSTVSSTIAPAIADRLVLPGFALGPPGEYPTTMALPLVAIGPHAIATMPDGKNCIWNVFCEPATLRLATFSHVTVVRLALCSIHTVPPPVGDGSQSPCE
jgi:hypothetical protein